MNNANFHFRRSEKVQIMVTHHSHPKDPAGYPVINIEDEHGDVTIWPSLDQLEELHGVIGQYLHVHRPDPTAKRLDGPPCPECGDDTVDLAKQKLGHYCLKCGFVEAGDPAPAAKASYAAFNGACGSSPESRPAPTAKACEPDRRELIQRRMPSRERIQQVIDKSRPPAMACPACGEAMVLMRGDHPCWRCFQCGNAEKVGIAPADAASGEDRESEMRADARRATKEGERAMELAVDVNCPDCGSVNVKADVWEHGKPISGECPKCGERLYFDSPSKPRASVKVAGPALDIDETMYDMASSFEINRPRCPDSDYGCSEEQLEAVAQRQAPEVP